MMYWHNMIKNSWKFIASFIFKLITNYTIVSLDFRASVLSLYIRLPMKNMSNYLQLILNPMLLEYLCYFSLKTKFIDINFLVKEFQETVAQAPLCEPLKCLIVVPLVLSSLQYKTSQSFIVWASPWIFSSASINILHMLFKYISEWCLFVGMVVCFP